MSALTSIVTHALHTIAHVSPWALAAALVAHLVKVVVEARSWHEIVAHTYPEQGRVAFRTTFAGFAAAIGANAVLPARVGEALRVGIVRRRVSDSSIAALSASIALETLIEVFFGVIVILVWVVSGGPLPALRSSHLLPLLHNPLVLIGIGLATIAVALAIRRYRGALRIAAAHWWNGFSILKSPGVFVRRVLGWKVVAWLLRLVTVMAFLAAFHLPASPVIALAVLAGQTVAGAIPLLPGNAGTQQAAIAVTLAGTADLATLVGFGVGMQAALTLADVVLGLVAVALVTPLGRRRMVQV